MDKTIIIDHVSFENSLKDVSITIQKGESVGIISVDHFSRDSILNIISGLNKPSSGFVSVLGYDPYLRAFDFLKQISLISDLEVDLTKDMLPINTLEITKLIYGLSDRDFNKNLRELTVYIQDPNLLNKLIYKPKIVLFGGQNYSSESVYEYTQKNEVTTLFSTNKFDHLINLVRRIIILDDHKIIYDGVIDEIVSKFATDKTIKIKLSAPVDPKKIDEIAKVKKYAYPYVFISSPRSVVTFTAAEIMQNFPCLDISIEELSIEEIIKNMKDD